MPFRFAYALARTLHRRVNAESKVVFISSPTAYVAYAHLFPSPNNYLFEFDERFTSLSKNYVHYDLFNPAYPKELEGQVDLVVVDPPFLNRHTNECVSQALKGLVKPQGEVVLLTSTSVRELVEGPQGLYKDVGQGYLYVLFLYHLIEGLNYKQMKTDENTPQERDPDQGCACSGCSSVRSEGIVTESRFFLTGGHSK